MGLALETTASRPWLLGVLAVGIAIVRWKGRITTFSLAARHRPAPRERRFVEALWLCMGVAWCLVAAVGLAVSLLE